MAKESTINYNYFIFWLFTLNLAIVPFVLISNLSNNSFILSLSIQIISYEIVSILLALYLSRSELNISILMFYTYYSVFFLYPSFFHISFNVFPVFNLSYSKSYIEYSSLYTLLFILIVSISYSFSYNRNLSKRNFNYDSVRPERSFKEKGNEVVTLRNCIAFSLISWMLFLFSMTKLSVYDFLQYRKEIYDVLSRYSADELGLYMTLPRIFSFLSITCSLIYYKFSKNILKSIFVLIINVPIFIILNFPFALPRFYIFGYLIFWIFIAFDISKRITKSLLIGSFVFGACFVMPVFDAINRRGKNLSDISFADTLRNYVSGGDFDGFQSFINATIYVESWGVNFGKQIISAILFFIPRSIWTEKGESTGTITAQAAGYSNQNWNVSAPIHAEFYVDFGILGLVLGGILLGLSMKAIDRSIDRNWSHSLRFRCVAATVGGFSIIFFRGALLAVGPMLFTLALGVFIMRRIVITDKSRRKRTTVLPVQRFS